MTTEWLIKLHRFILLHLRPAFPLKALGEHLFPGLFQRAEAARIPWIAAPPSILKATAEHLPISLLSDLHFLLLLHLLSVVPSNPCDSIKGPS